jgi:hypothetical protein
MATAKVDPKIAGARFSAHEFAWDWKTSQLIARATGCSIGDELDRPLMLKDSDRPGHIMIPFNGALVARNRAEVMDRLIGGYDVWQDVGRWGSGGAKFLGAVARSGRGRVGCGFTEVGATSKGHALVRFTFEVDDAVSGERLMEGWMLLFLLGCGSEGAGKLSPPRVAMPERDPDRVVEHHTPVNVTFDWAVPSEDWNTTHFETKGTNPAPLVHGPRNMALVLQDAAHAFTGGRLERVKEITLGSLPAPHYPPEPTQTRFWKEADGRLLGRLVVPAAGRIDGGSGDKVVIDQVELKVV